MSKISKKLYISALFLVGFFIEKLTKELSSLRNSRSLAPLLLLILAIFLLKPMSVFGYNLKDTDKDGLIDYEEINIYYTDPHNPDTDNDGYSDGIEIQNGYSPHTNSGTRLVDVDSDNDYLNDDWELKIGTDIMNPDTDGDSYLDGTEVVAGYNPLSIEVGKIEKYIIVSIDQQHLWYYFGDVLLEDFPISSGTDYTPTPIGNFEILDKVPSKVYGGTGYNFYYPNTKWNLHFTSNRWRYYIHGAYWHNNFGQKMSHGCVNVSYDNMERLYWFTQIGTKVEIY